MAQVFSQNGWPAYDNTDHYVRWTERGFSYWAANNDVGLIFSEVIRFFDDEIEEITQKILDDWSYANRLVRGSTSVVSNHGSATAIDLNATQHPRGVHNTFTRAEQAKLHGLKARITDDSGVPVLRLGMDYKNIVDDMHFEIDANAKRVRQAANKIRKQREELDVDEKTLRSIIRSEVVDLLKVEKIVPNVPTKAAIDAPGPTPPTTYFTTVGALSNIEGDADNDRDTSGRVTAADRETLKAIAQQQGRILELLGKLSPPDPS